MGDSKFGDRFFESTRGHIVALLRGSTKTVDELSKLLELTDNAVRAHLATLERDGLVRQTGTRRGLRKPHYQYSLTPEAEVRVVPTYTDARVVSEALHDRYLSSGGPNTPRNRSTSSGAASVPRSTE